MGNQIRVGHNNMLELAKFDTNTTSFKFDPEFFGEPTYGLRTTEL